VRDNFRYFCVLAVKIFFDILRPDDLEFVAGNIFFYDFFCAFDNRKVTLDFIFS